MYNYVSLAGQRHYRCAMEELAPNMQVWYYIMLERLSKINRLELKEMEGKSKMHRSFVNTIKEKLHIN